MTKPAQARQGRNDAPRTYAWPPLPPHEFEVISVTSAKDVYPKPWLTGWAVKQTAERAVDKYEFLGKMIAEDEKGALKWLKDARWSSAGEKADRGTIVHAALEAHLAGHPLSKETVEEKLVEARVPQRLWRSTAAMIAGLMEFLDDEEPEIYWSESTVYSRTHHYAGTPDIVARVRVGGKLVPTILDVKTSSSIYDDTSLQLVAYAKAEFVGMDDGTEEPLTPTGEPINHGIVIRPTANGRYDKAVFDLSDELFQVFLHCRALATAGDVVRGSRRAA